MATEVDTIKSDYPLPVYNYKVTIGEDAVGFSEVSGLDIVYDTITYKESKSGSQEGAGPNVMHMPGQGTPANITLKKGVVIASSVALYEWISSITLNQVEKKDIMIQLCDEEGNAVVSWTVINAFPTKLEAPSFSADSNEVAIDSLELMADDVKVTQEG